MAKIIMITADQTKVTRDKIYKFSHTKIIVKPIDTEKLIKLIME